MENFYAHEFLREKIKAILTLHIDFRRKSIIRKGADEKSIPASGNLPEDQEIDDFLYQLLTDEDDIHLIETLVVGPYVFPGIGIDLSEEEFAGFIKKAEELAKSPTWLDGHGMYTTFDGEIIDADKIKLQSRSEFNKSELRLSEIRLEIARFSPSFKILEKLIKNNAHIEQLHWREFEELVADLLHHDGYTVRLGPGRSDGGKDIIAIKEFEGIGSLMTVWQAKKLKNGNKVGINIIRELADTRNEHKASKGIIVTSTYLTKGAFERVKRDEYVLGKVDRNDLRKWIERVAYSRH